MLPLLNFFKVRNALYLCYDALNSVVCVKQRDLSVNSDRINSFGSRGGFTADSDMLISVGTAHFPKKDRISQLNRSKS